MAGLLDTFTISKRGLTVQQSNINTSSHNIANANTEGFSRQRSVIETTRPFGGTNKWETLRAGQVGTGAQVTAIQRVRNLFLDYQVREKMTQTGTADIKYQYLYQTENILNDSSDAGIQNALNKFFEKFQELSKTPESTTNRENALSQAKSLANMLNSKYTQLETKKSNMQELLKTNVYEINSILDNINSLNKQIRSVAVVGMAPNDLMDKRDLLIDQLSSKFGIEVDRDEDETINLDMSQWDYRMRVGNKTADKLVSSDPDTPYLRFAAITGIILKAGTTDQYIIEYSMDGTTTKTFDITLDSEQLNTVKQNRVLITDQDGNLNLTSPVDFAVLERSMFSEDKGITKGEVIGNIQTQEYIQSRMDELDKLAATLAYTVNAIQTGSIDGNSTVLDGNFQAKLIFVNKDESSETDDKITAKNITVNSGIIASDLICGEDVSDVSGTKAGTRALAIADLATTKLLYSGISNSTDLNREDYLAAMGITGFSDGKMNIQSDSNGTTMKDYYISIVTKLGTEIKAVEDELTTCTEELQQYDEQRMSESGVSLDEEMTDLITFQHAYQANAKMINTIDQLLDVVINGLKA